MVKKLKSILRIRNILLFCLLLLLVTIGLEIQDSYRKYGKFRTMQDPIATTEKVDVTGLQELRVAGGPPMALEEIKKHLKDPANLILVDGRKSRDGYINGIPVTYLSYSQEDPHAKAYFWRLFYTGTYRAQLEKVVSPSKEAETHGLGYVNFEIGSKYPSSNEAVEGFVKFFDTLPKESWVYFHCRHGKGRTSMMLVMWDIMANAPKVTLKDIVKRQFLLGSVDLFDTTPWTKGTYNVKKLEARKQFIEKFYAYVCQKKAGGIQSWSEWKHQK